MALAFAHVSTGRRANGRCVALSHADRTKPKCKRSVPDGSLPISGHAGRDKVGFQGRLSRTAKLAAGNYTATLTTKSADGTRTLTRPLSFTILP